MDEQRVQRGPNSGPPGPDWGPPPVRVGALPARPVDQWANPTGPWAAPPAPVGQPPPPRQPAPGQPARRENSGRAATTGRTGRPPLPFTPWLVVPIVTAAVLADITLRSKPNSVVAALTGLIVGGLVVSGRDRRRLAVLAPVGLSIAALTVAAFRSSPWVVVPCMIVAGLGLVIAGQDRLHSPEGWFTIIGHWLTDSIESVGWLIQPFRRRSMPKERRRVVLRGFVLATVVIAPITALLASGDAVFGELLLQVGSGGIAGHVLVAALMVPVVAGVALAARRPPSPSAGVTGRVSSSATFPISMVEATMVLGAVIVVLALWGMTQLLVALGGADRLLATADLTAAENARSGFFQLVAVTAMLIAVIAGLDRFTARTSAGDHRRFLALTAVLGVETLGLVWSSYSRLALYVNGFGNTMLRTSVAWFLAWLAAAMVLLIAGINLSRRRGGGPSTASGLSQRGSAFILAGIWIVAFAASNPEAAVARGNLQRSEASVALDHRYLTEDLGWDAVPVLVDGLDDLDDETSGLLYERLCRQEQPVAEYGVLGWNRSASRAGDAFDRLQCP